MNTVTFGIPFQSKRIARDWALIQRLLSNTMSSVLNQNYENIRIVLACHETPDIPEIGDSRVIVAPVEFDIPRFRWEPEIDRLRKVEVIGAELFKLGGGWLFILDADDLVSSSLADAIAGANTKAIVVRSGYRFDAQRGSVKTLQRFWRKCGSCNAVRWTKDELPRIPLTDNPPVFRHYAETRHFNLPQFFDEKLWSYRFLEGRPVTYVVNHGQNKSQVRRDSLRWRLYLKYARSREWSNEEFEEFGTSKTRLSQTVYSGTANFGVNC